MFVLIDKTTKMVKEWGGFLPNINDPATEEVVEVSDEVVPSGFNTDYMKAVGGKLVAIVGVEKTAIAQARKVKLDSDKWDEIKPILTANLNELKTLLGI